MKMKITFTLDEQQANWLLSALEVVMDGVGDSNAPEMKFLRRIRNTIERRLTPRALDGGWAAVEKNIRKIDKLLARAVDTARRQ